MPNGIQIDGKPIISIDEEAIGNLRTGSMLGTGIGGGYGFRTIPYYYWVPYTFKPAKTTQELKIIGIKNAYLQPSTSPYGMTLKKFDTASYVDRAILQLKNETAGNVVVRDISIRGEPVYQIAGQNGFVWEYSDYDSIDKNGEQFKEIGNDFIFDSGQAESIGDFAWKLLKPHQVYTLALRGCQYQYQIGDVYTLNVNYSLDASSSQIELVNVDVEIIGVSFERSVGSVGSTMLACRVDLGAWSKTTSRRAQLVGTGQANNNTNRTNTVTVASSTYTGTADYYCDGTDDHVEIQKAINDIYAIGGGTVQLTNGTFNLASTIYVYSNIVFRGMGNYTEVVLGNSIDIDISGSSIIVMDMSIHNPLNSGEVRGDITDECKIINCNFYDYSKLNIKTSIISKCNFYDSAYCSCENTSVSECYFDTLAVTPCIVTGSTNAQITNNKIKMNNPNGFAIQLSGNDCIISGNVVTGYTSTTIIYGIYTGGSRNIISNNKIDSVVGVTSAGIRVGGFKPNVSGNTSLNCTINFKDDGSSTLSTGNIFA